MYRNRKFKKNVQQKVAEVPKRALNTIDENTTIKMPRTTLPSDAIPNDVPTALLSQSEGSEENIPASQEQTQRYLSQRSVLAATLGRTQSRLNCTRPPNTYFELALMQAGVQLDESDCFILSCDHVTFVSKFRDILLKAHNYPENLETFKTGLTNALSAKSKLVHKLLTGCTISAPGEEHVYQTQDSMFVNFLIIDLLRDAALEVLLDKIEGVAQTEPSLSTDGSPPLLPLLLTQLRYVTLTHNEQIYSRIKRIFLSAHDAAKSDIIASAEYILDASKHDDFAEILIESYSQSKDLFHIATVQTLTNLSLSTRLQTKLSTRVLAFIKDNQCNSLTLPYLVRFLLKILNADSDEGVRELVCTLREIFNCRTQTNASREAISNKQAELELFNFLEQGLTRSKRFYSNWQKTIAGLPPTQFKSFDFVILLMLIRIKEDNSLYIENILRRRIKLEHITVDILDDIKNNFPHILEQHISTLMQILHDFMRERHKIVADFAKASYGVLFKICDAIQKTIIKQLLELTCDKTAQGGMINTALHLLKDLQRKYPKDVQNWGMLLLPLLDRLHEMSLSQTRLVMELLCRIAFPPPQLGDCGTLQDQIDMLVKKQLINRTAYVKKQGIISSVQLINCIARIEISELNSDDLNTTYNTISEMPDGRGKMAANCVTRTQSATTHCAESLALFYDELASVCATPMRDGINNELWLDKPFLIWLCELMTYYFQNNFVAEDETATINGIKLAYKMCINSIDDTTTNSEAQVLNIGINISELALKPTGNAHSSIIVLAPLFNLVRTLQLQRYEGSLESINALLGCAIVLPEFFDDATADGIYFDYDATQQKRILDIFYYTVNWMRVTICAFATQREASTRAKVLQRLTELIQIEQKIKLLLARAPMDYVPPQSQFVNTAAHACVAGKSAAGAAGAATRGRPAATSTKVARSSRGRAQQTETENVTFNDITLPGSGNRTRAGEVTAKLANVGKVNKAKPKIDFEHLYGPKEIYRQLDTDIMLLLHEDFNLKYPLEAHELGKQFGLLEFRFVMSDLVHKLESIIGTQKCQEQECHSQYIAKPFYFICDLSKFLHIIGRNATMLAVVIDAQLEQAQHVYSNGDLFTEHFNYLKICFGLCVRLLAAYFDWPDFLEVAQADLLKDSLLALLPEDMRKQQSSQPKCVVAAALFAHYKEYAKSLVNLGTAVQLIQLLQALRRHANAEVQEAHMQQQQPQQLAQDTRKLCRTLLTRKWYHYDGTMEKGAQCNIHLDTLIKGFLKESDFKRQKEILRVVHVECNALNSKEGSLKSFPNIKKANFPLLFRALCETLVTALSDRLQTATAAADGLDKLQIWEKSCNLLNLLLDIVQNVVQPRNFLLFLKHSHLYLKLMLQHGLQVLETYLRENTERVSALLKNLQQVTRYLHNLCCHSKALQNLSIISQIPFLRETVENLLFRVKALLAANKCHSVFWMGNLVNKDLHGDTLVTQCATGLPAAGRDSAEDSESELPEDDTSVHETVLDTMDDSAERGAKETLSNTRSSKSRSRSKCF